MNTPGVRYLLDSHADRWTVVEQHGRFDLYVPANQNLYEMLVEIHHRKPAGVVYRVFGLPWWKNRIRKRKWRRDGLSLV